MNLVIDFETVYFITGIGTALVWLVLGAFNIRSRTKDSARYDETETIFEVIVLCLATPLIFLLWPLALFVLFVYWLITL